MDTVNNAGFGTRAIAWLIDMIAMGILSFVLTLLFSGFISIGEAADGGLFGFLFGAASLLLVAINFFLQFLYFGYLWSKSGQSFGMIAMNIRVTRQDGHSLVSFFRGGLRGTIGYWISGVIFGLGYLWAFFGDRHETWHDKIFDTWVIVPSPFEVKE